MSGDRFVEFLWTVIAVTGIVACVLGGLRREAVQQETIRACISSGHQPTECSIAATGVRR